MLCRTMICISEPPHGGLVGYVSSNKNEATLAFQAGSLMHILYVKHGACSCKL